MRQNLVKPFLTVKDTLSPPLLLLISFVLSGSSCLLPTLSSYNAEKTHVKKGKTRKPFANVKASRNPTVMKQLPK